MSEAIEITGSSTQERLSKVDMAIDAVLTGGQEYQIGSRRLTRADLKQLYAMRNDLQAQVNSEKPSALFDNTYVAEFMGR